MGEEQAKANQEFELANEHLVAQCMHDAGFEYFVTVSAEPAVTRDAFEQDRDFVAQWGYGIINQPTQPEPEAPAVDQNAEYVATLSDAEKAAYNEAMMGPMTTTTNADGQQIMSLGSGGCLSQASQQLNAQTPDPVISSEFDPLFEALAQMRNNISSGNVEQFKPIEADWVNCMADAGYPGFTVHMDAISSFVQNDIGGLYQTWDQARGNVENSPEYAALADREIDLALADYDCRAAVNYEARKEAATQEVEAQFVADHKAELEALRASAEQG